MTDDSEPRKKKKSPFYTTVTPYFCKKHIFFFFLSLIYAAYKYIRLTLSSQEMLASTITMGKRAPGGAEYEAYEWLQCKD